MQLLKYRYMKLCENLANTAASIVSYILRLSMFYNVWFTDKTLHNYVILSKNYTKIIKYLI